MALGCGDGFVAEPNCPTGDDCDVTSVDPCASGGCNDEGYYDPTYSCVSVGCNDEGYNDEGYLDEGYNDEGYLDEGFDEGWDEGYEESFDEGYYPTTDYTSSTTLPDTTGTVSTSTTDTDSSDTDITASSTGTTDGTDTGTDTGTSGTDTGSDTGTSGTDTGTDTGTETGTDTGTSGTDTGTETDTDTGGLDAFPPAGAFGDDVFGVQEQDLIGVWSLQWEPDANTPDSVLTIDASGEFIWRETSADCTTDTLATGFVWVESSQLVMHVESWERTLPFDTLAALGEDFPAPFRLRMQYGLLGPNLGLTGPVGLTEVMPYTGRAYIQLASEGQFIAGDYYGETELWAVRDGDALAKVIVRERFVGDLDVEPALDPEGTGIIHHDQIYWGAEPPILGVDEFEGGNWTCYGGCPQPAGQTLINGGNNYAYGPYAANQRLMVYAPGRSFKRDVDTDCP